MCFTTAGKPHSSQPSTFSSLVNFFSLSHSSSLPSILSWIAGGATRCPNCNKEVGSAGIIGPVFASFGQNHSTSPDLTDVSETLRIKRELKELKEERERTRLELRQIGEIAKLRFRHRAKSAMNEGLFDGWKQSKAMWRSLPNERLPIILASYQTKLALADDERRREAMANRSATARIQELKLKNAQLKRQVVALQNTRTKSPPPYCHCTSTNCICPAPPSAPILKSESPKKYPTYWGKKLPFKEQHNGNLIFTNSPSNLKRSYGSDHDDNSSTTDDGSGESTILAKGKGKKSEENIDTSDLEGSESPVVIQYKELRLLMAREQAQAQVSQGGIARLILGQSKAVYRHSTFAITCYPYVHCTLIMIPKVGSKAISRKDPRYHTSSMVASNFFMAGQFKQLGRYTDKCKPPVLVLLLKSKWRYFHLDNSTEVYTLFNMPYINLIK
ncbi:hypothetical protein PHYBLDRAFT_59556 [Phycomyces blakesleeanus NRRL 1555(-)]|uniref:Uncharacterized protein n=1 Tax=Phycomyces blakesleeanus (strain ATCC 8743b / DSM 1359 / FGSC 10004 / NBRC 33097 / NRRL 1555) TaxID=763407 RepID=A0A162UKV6_PHYB8|nr:hypothetical protein PHYBLDRAFT_59556 [Phycomyces blakesleeanus NRRL 1555(-)]OAD76023.1 hypothetical protein PHYBLDRAFT_59556 [Phycomyces blakesleeanus NRRL 1555(-)]|eukprot:XP_018294063.1 hypothetical protein PHYBLDRAFT_59556 [Phycomyces blakesleeanus NRRL 1555(-)]